MASNSFCIVRKPGRRISLERISHPCPKCRHSASVQLIRSEKQWLVFNKCISSVMRVQYECSRCKFRNIELPSYSNEMEAIFNDHTIYHNSTANGYSTS